MVLQSLIHSTYTTESHFLNLPPELIVSILEETRWRDLLTVRRVCRRLYDFSRSHAVWCGIFSRYLAGLPRIFRRPQTYLDRYTPRELEHLVISQICAEIGWIKPDATWLYRRVKLNENLEDQCLSIVPKSIRLIEGGRWLLVGTETGSIIAYDLDTPEPKGEILLQPDDIMDVQEIFDICVEVDRTSPTLAVNVALTPFSFYSGAFSMRTKPPRLRVWRIAEQGNGPEAKPTVKKLNAFSMRGEGSILTTSLLGDHFARGLRNAVQIYKWSNSTTASPQMATIIPQYEPECIRLLPNNKLLFFSVTHMALYEIPPMKAAGIGPKAALVTQPLWKVACAGIWASPSKGGLSDTWIHPDGQTIRLALATIGSIYGIVIPYGGIGPPRFTLLAPYKSEAETVFCVGLHKAFARKKDSTCAALSYYWEDEVGSFVDPHEHFPPNRTQTEKIYSGRWTSIPPLMDEQSGRVVQCSSEDFLVMDTSIRHIQS